MRQPQASDHTNLTIGDNQAGTCSGFVGIPIIPQEKCYNSESVRQIDKINWKYTDIEC